MGLTRVTPPYAEPIHLAEAESYLRQEETNDDALIQELIGDAREYAEDVLAEQLVVATWKLTLESFADRHWAYRSQKSYGTYCPEIWLPKPPLVSVSSVKYVDTAGVQQTLATTDYQVDAVSIPGRIVPAYGKSWPTTRNQPNAVEITYLAGYVTPWTVDPATDLLTWQGRQPVNDTIVRLSSSGGVLPAGLATFTDYYVVQAAGATCKLSLTQGGAGIDVTNAGTGTHFVGAVPSYVRQAMRLFLTLEYENRLGDKERQRIDDLLRLAGHGEYP